MKAKHISSGLIWEGNDETHVTVSFVLPKALLKRKANGVVKDKSRKELADEVNDAISKVEFPFTSDEGPKSLEEVLAPYSVPPYKLY